MTIAEKMVVIAENEQRVYDAGYAAGQEAGGGGGDTEAAYNEGFTDGKKSEYDRFWDTFQQKGNAINYGYAFGYDTWTDELFKPKYDIIIKAHYGGGMFAFSKITDLKDKMEAQGVKLDLSEATAVDYLFRHSEITHIPELDLRKATSMLYAFGDYAKSVTIDKLIVSETTNFSSTTFNTANWLQNITFEGTIGVSINFQWSPLTRQSIESVMAALSENTHDLTATFQKTAVEAAFTTQEWNDLTATRTNWNIALV